MNRRTIDIIERAVKVPDVLRQHGHEANSRGRCRCPVCASKRDSFSITDTLYHCFACGESGGVIQLEASLSGITDDDACKVLADRYGLDISDRPLTAEEKQNLALEKRLEESYREYKRDKRNYYRRMTVLFRNIREVPELYDMAKSLRDWLDDNLNEVVQEWNYQSTV